MSENNKGYRYKELFSDNASKAKAFDEIAENVFAKRFCVENAGKVSFALFYNALAAEDYSDPSLYSDIAVAELLGMSRQAVIEMKQTILHDRLFRAPRDWWKRAFLSLAEGASPYGKYVQIKPLDTILRNRIVKESKRYAGEVKEREDSLLLEAGIYFSLIRLCAGKNGQKVAEETKDRIIANDKFAKKYKSELQERGFKGFFEQLGQKALSTVAIILVEVIGRYISEQCNIPK